MDSQLWAKAHGATTHFPVALVLCSALLDGAGFAAGQRPIARDLHAAGYWTIILGGAGTIGAVFSGILMTKGSILGHGALRMHHLFVWPAFAAVVALTTFRVICGHRPSRPVFGAYLAALAGASGLILAAAYWGGELMSRA